MFQSCWCHGTSSKGGGGGAAFLRGGAGLFSRLESPAFHGEAGTSPRAAGAGRRGPGEDS